MDRQKTVLQEETKEGTEMQAIVIGKSDRSF